MNTRKPAVAGQFYPGSQKQCRTEIIDCLTDRPVLCKLPETIVAGIVPHAGWTFSGDLAGMVFAAIEKIEKTVDTFIIFGTAHSYFGQSAAVYDTGGWQTPLGEIKIDEELAAAIIEKSQFAKSNPDAHKYEHSIEVQLPFIQHLFPNAKIVPLLTPPGDFVVQLGKNIAECILNSASGKKIVCIGSTDLTHYGPRYGFNPQGNGASAIEWAKNVNDKFFIDAALDMQAEKLLTSSIEKENACGPGAAAAAISAAKSLGKTKGILLAHTNSSEVMEKKFGQTSSESVGYAAIVY
ncbi:MAG: AmmeMemoRadiSam system protein B [Sedimentisphaerales bacterium]